MERDQPLDYSEMPDGALAKAACSDSTAFEHLVGRYYPLIITIARARLRNPESAEDLAQEVVLRLYLNLDNLRDTSAFPRWIRQVTRNLASHWVASVQVRSRLVPMVSFEEVPSEVQDLRMPDARDRAGEKQERSILEVAITRLPPALREVVLLHYAEGLSKSEVARQLGIHPSSVGRHLDRALVQLREDLLPVLREAAQPLASTRRQATRIGAFALAVAGLTTEAKSVLGAAAAAQSTGTIHTGGGLLAQAGAFATTFLSGGLIMAKIKVIGAGAAVLAVAVLAASQYPNIMGRHEPIREFRGVWIPSVSNLDWPSKKGLSSTEQQGELLAMLDKARELRMNAVALQVRPCADALYDSKLEPWSEFLTGQQGQSPGWDPLEFAVREGHKRCLEVHAWVNPYRAHHVSEKSPKAETHISKSRPNLVKPFGKMQWMDPGEPEATQHVLNVVQDIVSRYDVDAIHFDDYFYPYPENDATGKAVLFPDDTSWGKYVDGGGKLNRGDWRRENINQLIRRTNQVIKQTKPHVLFGVAPVGAWRPDHPSGARAADIYDTVYADTRKWWNEGWVDYLSPQLYYPLVGSEPKNFPTMLNWWKEENHKDRHLWPGMMATQDTAMGVTMTRKAGSGLGNMHFSMGNFMKDVSGKNQALKDGVFAEHALVPATPWLDKIPPAPPVLSEGIGRTGQRSVQWKAGDNSALKHWCLYRKVQGKWSWMPVPVNEDGVVIRPEDKPVIQAVAVTAVDRAGNESTRAELPFIK